MKYKDRRGWNQTLLYVNIRCFLTVCDHDNDNSKNYNRKT